MQNILKTLSLPPIEVYESGKFVVLDFETTATEYGSPLNLQNKIVLACWYTSWDNRWHSHWGEEYELADLLSDIEEADFLVAQNAKFELGWLDRCGLDLRDVTVWDTMLAEWVLLGNVKQPKDLNSMLLRRGLVGKEDIVGGMIKLGIDPENIPRSMLEHYCFEDVRGTLELFRCQMEELRNRDQMHLVYSRCMLTPLLTLMEREGVNLDKEAVEKEYSEVKQERDRTKEELEKFATINWQSKQQVAEFLYDNLKFKELTDRKGAPLRTGTGRRSATSSTISSLRATSAAQKKFLELYLRLAKLNTRLSKTLEFFREICHKHNGVFHGAFNQGSTGTHRLSSSGRPVIGEDGSRYSAQLQNIPREYKRFIKARNEGWTVIEADGAQLEFRVGADMGRDAVAIEEIANDVDIHTNTAKVFLEDGTQPEFKGLSLKEARQPAKPQTFKPLYGGSGTTSAERAYCEFFQKKYAGIYKTQYGWSLEVLKNKELRTPYGMIFYWPDTTMMRNGKVTNTTAIFNYPVQGLATAEIIPIVLVSLWKRLRDLDVKFVLTVHDSIVLEVGPDVDRRSLYNTIARAFTRDVYDFLQQVYGYEFITPLGCGVKEGEVWGSGKEYKAKMFPDNNRIIWQ